MKAAYQRYETALVSNDVETLDALFRDDPHHSLRHDRDPHGHDEIKGALRRRLRWAMRKTREP